MILKKEQIYFQCKKIEKALKSSYGADVKADKNKVGVKFLVPSYLKPANVKVVVDKNDKGFYVTTYVGNTDIAQTFVKSSDAAITRVEKEMYKLDNGNYDDEIGRKE